MLPPIEVYYKLGCQLDLSIIFATGLDILWLHSKTSGALHLYLII